MPEPTDAIRPSASSKPPKKTTTLSAPPGRLVSLDAFRGFAIAGMLFVNNPGTWNPKIVPGQLLHAEWHGCTFADLIFPFFLFIVGVAMPFSDARRQEKGIPFGKAILTAAGRAIVLYLIGAFLVSGALNRPVLYFGILQRIAVLYFATFLLLRLKVRWQAILAAALLFIWWGFMAWGTAPGVVTGSFVRDINFAQYIDKLILPEGNKETLFSLIPGMTTVLIGILIGRLLLTCQNQRRVMQTLAAAGIAGFLLGIAWQPMVPWNKILWTSSFTLYAAGWSILVLLFFYWLIEVKQWRRAAFPLIVFGMNAITLYVATGLFVRGVLLSWQVPYNDTQTSLTGYFYKTFAAWTTPTIGSLLYSTLVILLAFALGHWMYRRKLFLKV